MTFREYLSSVGILDDEGERLELKEAQVGVPKSLWETVSSFSNTRGGRILLSVSQDREVLGLASPDKLQAEIASSLRQVMTPSIPISLNLLEIDGKPVVEVEVPPAEPYLRPVYITSRGVQHGAFKRIGSSDIRLSAEDLIRIASERSGVSPDQQVPPGASFSHLDTTLMQSYRNRLRAARPDSPLLGYGDLELLRALGLAQDVEGTERPNRAAILLFGKQEAITRYFPGFAFQVIEVDGTEWNPGPSSRPRTLTLPVTGLVELASRIAEEIVGRIPEGVHLQTGALPRAADPVHVAVREGVVNALIHQDYLAFQPTQFRRFSDRLEMENPGTSRKPLSHFDRPGSSPRNPLLARAFNIVGLAEQVGSGILTMKRGFRNAGLAEPVFESDESSNQFRVAFYWHNLATEDEIHRVGKLGELNEDQRRALLVALRSGRMDNATYRELTGKNIVRASEALRRLVELGLLERRGSGSSSYYVPTGQASRVRSGKGLFDIEEPD